ncbi:MAG: hypothetical protein B6D55_06040 [Candidatus Omnitrophica bacterium 4484_70.2]|nr:MAG: hypothetical protein B6D55_06040 [Candidatus Omnitrophica bacterium 4484_70.2]
MKLLIIGPPASGKGTQAERIADKFKLEHISTGDIFRKMDDEEISQYLASGKLLPDELVFRAVKEKIDRKENFILDGYPRNVNQAKMLDSFLEEKGSEIDYVIYLKVSDETIIKRMTSRRTCKECGKTYNIITSPPPEDNKCECGGELIQRDDDKEEVVRDRLRIFRKVTQPVIDHYINKLIVVDGELSINDVFNSIYKRLKEEKEN